MTAAAEQLDLLDTAGRAHFGGHDTEIEAAQSVNVRPLQEKVLEILRQHPAGLTDDQGAELLGPWADRLTFGRRRSELFKAGLVAKTSVRRVTPHGKSAIVWQAAS